MFVPRLLRRIVSDYEAADQVLAPYNVTRATIYGQLQGLDRSISPCVSCQDSCPALQQYIREAGASIQLFAFASENVHAMEAAPKAKTVPTLPTLDNAHLEEISANVRGEVFRRGDKRSACAHVRHRTFPTYSYLLRFHEHTRLFNGNVVNTSRAVVLPLDARDVSQLALSFSLRCLTSLTSFQGRSLLQQTWAISVRQGWRVRHRRLGDQWRHCH